LEDRHDLLVRSVAVLLHPGADSSQLTGTIKRGPSRIWWRSPPARVRVQGLHRPAPRS
jgi:hypothetical protein